MTNKQTKITTAKKKNQKKTKSDINPFLPNDFSQEIKPVFV